MTPVVLNLVIANVIAFFLQLTQGGITRAFAFVPQLVLVRPWTIVTYMFLHGGMSHILFNMITLLFFGPKVEQRLGPRRFAILYFVSGLSGAVLSMMLAPGAPIIGASAAIFGVTLAFARFWPDTTLLIWGILPAPAWLMVIGTTIFSLFAGFTGMSGGIAHFAHLGGYAGAFIYLKLIERKAGSFRRKIAATAPKATDKALKWQSIDTSRMHALNREEVDRILDKISKEGIGSLTPQERLFLSNFVPPDDRPLPKQ